MRVLHVIPGLTNASGPTHALIQLVESLETIGIDVSVSYLGDRLEEQIEPTLRRGNIYPFKTVYLKHWGYSPGLHSFLDQHIASFDLVHIHSLWLYPGFIGSKMALKHQVPYLIRPAGSLEPEALAHKSLLKRLYFSQIEEQIINKAALIHAVSAQEQSNIERLGFSPRCITIPNGISPNNYSELPSKERARQILNVPSDAPVLCYVGRIHPIKGLELLVPIMKGLVEAFPTLQLIIGGPNTHPYAKDLMTQFKDVKLQHAVSFLGELDKAKKLLAYRAADLTVLPSKSENFAIVVAESLASETPVIASNRTPWEVLTKADAGEWIDLAPNLWIDTIKRRLASPEWILDAGRRGRKLVMNEFCWPSIARRLHRVYHEILEFQKRDSRDGSN